MSKKKPTPKADAMPVPQNQKEAEEALFRMGQLQRKLSRLEVDMNDAIAKIKAGFEKQALEVNSEIETLFGGIHAWAEVNKTGLLKKDAKTVRLATGELSWRLTPPKVSITKAEDVLKSLQSLGLTQFIRTKEEIDKEAMLADREKAASVNGVSISQKEEFAAKPFESEIEKAVAKKSQLKEVA